MTTQTATATSDWKPAILDSLAKNCFHGQKFSDLGEDAQEAIERVYVLSNHLENVPVIEAPAFV